MSASTQPDYRGATMALHSTVGFGGWAVGVAIDAGGGMAAPSGWLAAFLVTAVGGLCDPLGGQMKACPAATTGRNHARRRALRSTRAVSRRPHAHLPRQSHPDCCPPGRSSFIGACAGAADAAEAAAQAGCPERPVNQPPATDAARKAVRRSGAGSRGAHGTHSCGATPGPTAYALIAMACCFTQPRNPGGVARYRPRVR
jgi:hypothetical protein